MWESLGSSPRQDRVLHGAAKALNVAVGIVAMPLWLLGQRLREPFRRLLGRLDTDPAPLPIPAPRERSMDALMTDLQAIPHHLRHSEAAMLRIRPAMPGNWNLTIGPAMPRSRHPAFGWNFQRQPIVLTCGTTLAARWDC